MSNYDETLMRLALDLAKRGEGRVEPNPMVGCVLVNDGNVIGKGWHQKFGGPHAEVNAIQSVRLANPSGSIDGIDTAGATAYVTLEPCSHVGKTSPCSTALIESKVSRVVVACTDPNPQVSGRGIGQLRDAGIEVETDVLVDEAREVLAPYLKWTSKHKPWIIAKWAMTLDGRIATPTGDSKWISNARSRAVVHQIRGRVDGIMVGIGTAMTDDPMLTARPAGSRLATRIIVDSAGRIPSDSKIVQTANQHPTLIAMGPAAEPAKCEQLKELGCTIFQSQSVDANDRLNELLENLAQRDMTNILVEGGGQLLGSLNDIGQIDETHVFVGPKILGGSNSISPISGAGHNLIKDARPMKVEKVDQIGNDIYVVGRILR